jgi:hypothetical protein
MIHRSTDPVSRERVLARLASASGQTLWSAVAARGDSALAIDLGEKIRRAVRLSNPSLSFVHRTFEGSHRLLVECPWRLDGPRGVVASSSSLLGKDAPPALELADIEGERVLEAEVRGLGLDLRLVLSGGFELLCLSTEVGRRRSNWSFWCPEGSLVVGAGGELRLESRAQAEAEFRRLKRVIRDEEQVISAPRPRPAAPEGPVGPHAPVGPVGPLGPLGPLGLAPSPPARPPAAKAKKPRKPKPRRRGPAK